MATTTIEPTGPHYSTFEPDVEARLPAGARVGQGRFEVVDELGRGGMAVVYRARDAHADGREVALKVVSSGGERAEARYRNEARLGVSLAGEPHVVAPLLLGRLDGPAGFEGRTFMVTELVVGSSLDEILRQHRTGLEPQRAARIALDVARGLQSLHARGIVHRDVKPGNVVVTSEPNGEPGGERARLIDLGLAFATGDGWEPRSPDLTAQGRAPGTPLYMSPQQAAGERPHPSVDIYAFGVTLYELLSGNPPYEGLPIGVLLGRKCNPADPPFPLARMRADLPPALTQFVDRCLAYEPELRPTIAGCVALLDGFVRGGGGASLRVVPSLAALEVPADVSVETATGTPAETLADSAPPSVSVETPPPRPPAVTDVAPAPGGRAWVVAAVLVAAAAIAAAVWWSARRAATPPDHTPKSAAVVPLHPRTEAEAEPEPVRASTEPEPEAEAEAEAEPEPEPEPEPAPSPKPRSVRPPAAPAPDDPPAPSEDPPTVETPAEAPVPPPTCAQRRDRAQRADAAGRWSSVLQHTQSDECWTELKAMRTRLRVHALQQLGRYKACAREAARSKDPTVAKWGEACFRRALEDKASTP